MRVPLLGALLLAAVLGPAASADVVHQERSLYRNIIVRDTAFRRCLAFALKRAEKNQSCVYKRDPDELVFPYARMTFSGLLLNPTPASILMVGLGAGSIPNTLHQLYPDSSIDIVEIDPAVVKVARQFFNFNEKPGMRVVIADARVFVKRAGLRKDTYDLIILDAFTGDYIPEHLMTVEFLEEVKALMGDESVLVANTFSTSRLYDHESVSYRQVFPEFYNFKLPITGNRVIVTRLNGLPPKATLESRARELAPALQRYGIDILDYPDSMPGTVDWDPAVKPLTDQYSPANLLQQSSD